MNSENLALVFILLITLPTHSRSLYTRNNLSGSESNSITEIANSTGPVKRESAPSGGKNYKFNAEISREIGNSIIAFMKSIIPSLQPKVDFVADAITDGVDVVQGKLFQTLENTNNTIVGIEAFFNNMYEALIVNVNGGKGASPNRDIKRRQRLERLENNKLY